MPRMISFLTAIAPVNSVAQYGFKRRRRIAFCATLILFGAASVYGQPRNLTATAVFYVYLNSFPYLKLGYGAALSLILAAFILCFTVTQVVLNRRGRL